MDNGDAALSTRELLWKAFLAGFETSGEDCNGEHVGERYRGQSDGLAPALVERMRTAFDSWLDGQAS